MAEDRPKVRAVEVIPAEAHGRRAFVLRDPSRLSTREILLPPDMVYLLSQFDGTRTVREAQVSYVRRFGSLLTRDKIEDVLRQLDEALLLENEHFTRFRAQVETDFRNQPTRPMAHAGQCYPEGAAAFTLAWQSRLAAEVGTEGFRLDTHRPMLVAPHYDMNGAAECYAAAYRLLAEIRPPQVVVIFGVAHAGDDAPFMLTRKPFETPFGALDIDTEIVDRLLQAAPYDLLAGEFAHRDEHSIEFQTVLLHFLYHDAEPPRIVPILCGGYHRRGDEIVDPAEADLAIRFLEALHGLLADDPRRIALIASADLSHIGVRFGQSSPPTQAQLELARRHDLSLLSNAQTGDASGLYRVLAEEHDRYNVCGFPAIYALLRSGTPREGQLLKYQQLAEPQTGSCVSFAAVALR